MQPPQAAPLQIPSEDDVPLFDPSGLSASLSVDDWHSSFDLNSVAAARLGIGSPPSNSNSLANLTRSDSRNNTSSIPDTDPTSSHHDDNHHLRRGRRRRSSAAQPDLATASPTPVSSAMLPQKDTSVGSKVRMWWERSEVATPDAESSDAPTAKTLPRPEPLPPLRTDMRTAESSSRAEAAFASPAALSPESASPAVRSPAADFLSAFSSLNSVVQPATSYDSRSLSYSPPRAGHRSLGASLMRDDTRNGSAAAPGFASLRGLGSAAAQLYDAQITTAPNPPPRCDDEGARVGPAGRYLLGKTIGFGGFSTVREGWDLDAEGPPDPTAPIIDGQRKGRRVAVKIVYHDPQLDSPGRDAGARKQGQPVRQSHELNIWKSLPVHPHLLPLLHHECVELDAPHAAASTAGGGTVAELLIMPYCDQGNLLDFVRSEGGLAVVPYVPNGEHIASAEDRRSGSGSWMAPSPARSSMQLSRSSSLKASMEDATRRQLGSRTGSGFALARNAGTHALGRVASVSAASQLRTIPAGHEPASVASSPVSAAGSTSSGSRLIRRTTSRTSRSQGIPIDAARETMRQLASALAALHIKSQVLHGDLKLENVLGQDQASWKKRQRMSATQSDAELPRSRQNSTGGGLADSIDSLAASSVSSRHTFDITDAVMPCWRLADFGLSQVIDPAQTKGGAPAAPALIRALKEEAKEPREAKARGAQRAGRGGSLAYTAPEYLRAQGCSGSSSPMAADAAADDEAELPPESPFAADMWALGCILYALLSGRLPFADSFEPRLQMKIAKAQWEVPPRLRRRAERLASASTSTLVSQASVSNRNSFADRAGSAEPASLVDRFAFSQRRSASGAPARGPTSLGTMDLSASLPSLAPRERQATEPATSALPRRMMAVHSEQVVGSAPGRAHHVESFEINHVAKARADVEEDPESDDDSDLDPAWDGLSWDRAAVRQVLRGLLEPDPRRRWTVEQLCASAWIRQEGEPAGIAAVQPPALLPSNASALRSGQSTSTATIADATDAAGVEAERSAWVGSASRSSLSLTEPPAQPSPAATPSFEKANVDEQLQRLERGRRSSSLARTRPVQPGMDGSAAASATASPAISADEGASSAQRRSRSTSRIAGAAYRDSSRTRSTDVSGSSTPNRDRDPAWIAHHLGSSFNSQGWVQSASRDRCDSPAESERRGRLPRSRMADLDENTTWNGEDGTSSDSRAGSHAPGSVHRAGAIAIQGRSASRSRSRHSGESGSPERFVGRRSISRSRSTYSLSHEAGVPGSLLYGRSVEVQPQVAPIAADHTQAQRSSTARSRSRAPDALAQILGRQRSRSRSRMREGNVGVGLGLAQPGAATRKSAAAPSDSEHEHEARGRARDRR